ncbi:hypothetical protein F4553_007922 [Allocatelliglobosispora scoriae]|uniref:Helicase XPB/Ssl2 N-terminal domain-containing protein n=1 Tax=Allocatelliglobosispora scoriae TaxID=643052 RepID=A0A841C3Z4_9ACTN|nr:helicase C-terminal domain-containing protein [Allocatelliglobosispora scoriae]MBB5874488.1 hypothetical protein [Allocatelliglobosispora scoriae]
MIDAMVMRDLGEHGLTGLLQRRPDALTAPVPLSLTELAERLSTPRSVVGALQRLNRPTLQVAEAIAALGGEADPITLRHLLGRPDPAALQDAIASLVDHGLLRTGDRPVLMPIVRDAFGKPLGLGISVQEALARRTSEELRGFARGLRVTAAPRKAETLAAVTAALCDAAHVRAVVADAPEAVRDLLHHVALTGEDVDFIDLGFYGGRRPEQPERWAMECGLLVRTDWGYELTMPAEVALALRGETYTAPFDAVQPQVARVAVDPATIARAAAASGSSLVRHAAALLGEADRAPLTTLKSGGLGVREIRRLVKLMGCADHEALLCLDLAEGAGLLARAEAGVAPTAAYDEWLRSEPAARLTVLVEAWWRLPFVPLQPSDDPLDAPVLRSALLGEAALVPSSAVKDPAPLIASMIWQRPAAFGPGFTPEHALATWREASLLGLIGADAVSPAGHALLGGGNVATTIGDIGSSQRIARLQADLSAIVAGTPAPELTELLDLTADPETRGTASTWRFSPGSVRRALDAGHTAAELLDRLAAISPDGLPQPLTYLLNDVARRHGNVRAIAAGCCLRSDETALLAEIAADRRLRKLGLRLIAPTVLTSTVSLAETIAALRDAGYSPVAESADGQPVVEVRTTVRSATVAAQPKPRTAPADSVADPVTVAKALLAAPDMSTAKPTPTFAALRANSRQLSDAEVRVLAHVVENRLPVTIGYVDGNGSSSLRVIEEIELHGGSLHAWCRTRADTRMFNVSRIATVQPLGPGE